MKRFALLLFATTLPAFGEPFPRATPESQGIRSQRLCEMFEHLRAEQHDVRSLLILRNGKLVLEWSSAGVTRDHHHNVFSITKTIVSTLVGMAIGHDVIPSTQSSLGELFPSFSGVTSEETKGSITLDDLLSMRSGYPVSRANQTSGSERALFDRLQAAPDRLETMLNEIPLHSEPGVSFAYNNIDPALALAAIENQSGLAAVPFATRSLFDPLGFEGAKWVFADSNGRLPGGYGLRLRAIDLAKVGQLYLQGGQWEGKQLLDSKWIERATSDIHGDGYGYYWWIDTAAGSYAAKGVRGQRLVVHPDLQLVYVILSDLPPDRVSSITSRLANDYILKAVVSETAIPEDPMAAEELAEELRKAQRYLPPTRRSAPPFRQPQR